MNSPNTEPGLLLDIAEHPDDDDLRLIYADLLEDSAENGNDPRAALIRVQFALEQLAPDAPERAALQARERVLVEQERNRWLALFATRGLRVRDIRFERGFPTQVTMRATDFVAQADILFRMAPVTAALIYTGNRQEDLQPLFDSPHLSRLTALSLDRNRLDDSSIVIVIASPYLAGLTSLNVDWNRIGPAGIRALAASPHLTRLTELSLCWNDIGDSGARAAESPHLASLTTLGLEDNMIGDSGAQALANSPHLGGLTTLRVSRNEIGPEGAWALATSPHLARLTVLDLRGNLVAALNERVLPRADIRRILGVE